MFLTGLSKQWITSASRGSSKIEPISWRETSLDLNECYSIVPAFRGFD